MVDLDIVAAKLDSRERDTAARAAAGGSREVPMTDEGQVALEVGCTDTFGCMARTVEIMGDIIQPLEEVDWEVFRCQGIDPVDEPQDGTP